MPIYDELRGLLDSPLGGDSDRARDRLENSLTAGYAHALALEAEHWRIQRRLGEVAGALDGSDTKRKGHELAELGRRLRETDTELADLRTLLASVKLRFDQARRAA